MGYYGPRGPSGPPVRFAPAIALGACVLVAALLHKYLLALIPVVIIGATIWTVAAWAWRSN